nr:hypothetical protein 49p1_00078 [Yersinia frederiksenii]
MLPVWLYLVLRVRIRAYSHKDRPHNKPSPTDIASVTSERNAEYFVVDWEYCHKSGFHHRALGWQWRRPVILYEHPDRHKRRGNFVT